MAHAEFSYLADLLPFVPQGTVRQAEHVVGAHASYTRGQCIGQGSAGALCIVEPTEKSKARISQTLHSQADAVESCPQYRLGGPRIEAARIAFNRDFWSIVPSTEVSQDAGDDPRHTLFAPKGRGSTADIDAPELPFSHPGASSREFGLDLCRIGSMRNEVRIRRPHAEEVAVGTLAETPGEMNVHTNFSNRPIGCW